MTPLLVLVVAGVAWALWLPAANLQKRVRGETGSISIFPVPLFPLLAWGVALLLERASMPIGVHIVGGAHIVLLVVIILSIARSYLALSRRHSE